MTVDPERLRAHVRALEGERHPYGSPAALERAVAYVEGQLEGFGLEVRRHGFQFRGRSFPNVAGVIPGSDPSAPRVLVGAHCDSVRGTPGADDNASGVAGMLECARLLVGARPTATIELVGFNLEERQGLDLPCGQSQLGGAGAPGGSPLSRGTHSRDDRVPDPGSWEPGRSLAHPLDGLTARRKLSGGRR